MHSSQGSLGPQLQALALAYNVIALSLPPCFHRRVKRNEALDGYCAAYSAGMGVNEYTRAVIKAGAVKACLLNCSKSSDCNFAQDRMQSIPFSPLSIVFNNWLCPVTPGPPIGHKI